MIEFGLSNQLAMVTAAAFHHIFDKVLPEGRGGVLPLLTSIF